MSLWSFGVLLDAHLRAWCLLAVVLVLLRLAGSRMSAAARHYLLGAAFAVVLVLPLLPGLPRTALQFEITLPANPTPAVSAGPTGAAPLESTPATHAAAQPGTASPAKATPHPAPHQAAGLATGSTSPVRSLAAVVEHGFQRVAPWVTPAWLAGVVVFLLRLAFLHAIAALRLARATPVPEGRARDLAEAIADEHRIHRPIRLFQGPGVRVPFMWGVRCIHIVLPADHDSWSIDRLELVLRHELAHARREDCRWQFLTSVACALHWFNPFFWRAAARLRQESEHACDDLVVAAGIRPSRYATILAEFAGALAGTPSPTVLAMARPHDLTARVEAILDPRTPRLSSGVPLMKRTLAFSAALLAAIALVDVRVVAQDEAHARHAAPHKVIVSAGNDNSSDLGEAWYTIAWEAQKEGQPALAAPAFVKSANLGNNAGLAAYNAACSFARTGKTDDAFTWINRAIDLGFTDDEQLAGDEDLVSLHKDPRFKEAEQRMKDAPNVEAGKIASKVASAVGGAIARHHGTKKDIATCDADEAARREKARPDWEAFLQAAEPVEAALPKNAEIKVRIAYAQLMLGQAVQAKATYEALRALGEKKDLVTYNLACAQAQLGEKEAALKTLGELADSGWPNDPATDYDLRSLRDDPAFKKLVGESHNPVMSKVHEGLMKAAQAIKGHDDNVTIDAESGQAVAIDKEKADAPHLRELNAAGGQLFNLAYQLHDDGKHKEAIAGFKRCYDADTYKAKSAYNVACGYALEGDKESAFQWLDKAVEAGLAKDDVDVEDDDDLESLHSDPRFAEVVRKATSSKVEASSTEE